MVVKEGVGAVSHVVAPGGVVLIRHCVDPQVDPPDVVSFTTTVMVAPGVTVTLVPPFNVTELIVFAANASRGNVCAARASTKTINRGFRG